MAYAALVSLRRTIEEITLNPVQYSIDLHHTDRIRSINEGITFLQEFADKCPEEANCLEGRIMAVANEAQDVLKHFISKQIRRRFGLNKYIRFSGKFWRGAKFNQQLKKIRQVIDSIVEELMEMEKNGHTIEGQLQLRYYPATSSMEGEHGSPAANSSSAIVEELMEMEKNGHTIEGELQLRYYPATSSMEGEHGSPAANSSSAIVEELMEMEKNGHTIEGELQLRYSPATSSMEGDHGSPAANSSSAIVEELMEMEKNGHTIEGELQLSGSPAANSSSPIAVTGKINDVVGLDDDSIAIKTRLCGGSSKLQVIPIVGMGGIGKTTLSRNVYNDLFTIQYFDVRAWVTVSQDYSTQKIVSSLMDSLKEFVIKKKGQSNEETVYKSLKGRRYVIVVDDMWSRNAWDDVRDLFPNDNNGSRIVLTTRLSDVAAYAADSSPLHEMRFMGIEQSWELLRQRVFGDQDCSPQLEDIGKEIAECCKGLPLAISVIAGLLSMVEKNSVSWWEIVNNVRSIVVTEYGPIDEILSLSYAHLPHHLRPCFLYMGGFPEDYEICLSKLVRLWVADDFLSYSEGSSKSLEEQAEECLEDLVSRSLVLVTERKYNGRIKRCGLHDLIRDLCIRKAKEENFFLNITNEYVDKKHFIDSIKGQSRISVKSYTESTEGESGSRVQSFSLTYLSSIHCSTIHTILCFPTTTRGWYGYPYQGLNLDFLESVGFLRVLAAENVDVVESLPDELFTLFHLRYLAMSSVRGFMIPRAISKLQNLQTLIIDARNRRELTWRPDVDCLPQEIWMMPQLRHLFCYGRFPYPKQKTSTLENLQTLSLVLHDMCVEEILEKIPNIKKLGVDCSYYDYGTHLNNLEHLHQLQSLELRNGDWRRDSICFPRMLRKLNLCNMSLPWSEMSIVGSLPYLEVLKLRDFACIGSTWETSQGEFPQLQYLLIKTSKLQYWISEEYHFPRLKFLLLQECWYLNEIPEGIGEIATLERIDIRGYHQPKSLVESAKRIQEEQQSLGNDALQVHYPLLK